VIFQDSTTATQLGSATVVPTVSFSGNTYTYGATATLTTTAITASGANAITANYLGDTNYQPITSAPVTVTVGTGTATTTTLTASPNPTTLNGRPTFTATPVETATSATISSGTVSFYDGTALLGTGAVSSTTHTATFRPASGAAFWGGNHTITAVFGGTATDTSSYSSPYIETVTQGTTSISLTAKTVGTLTQTYTFAAVVAPSQTNATFAPNQSVVNFYDGTTLIGSAAPITVTSTQGGYGLWTATMSTSSLAFGSHTITAQYSDVNYSLATSNAQTIFVGGTPTVTWATPAAITYPAPLTAAQLNATANIPGTFVYTPALGTVLSAGNQTLSVTFTPADSTDFAPQTKTVTIPVLQIAQTISFTLASPITYSSGLTIPLVATGGASGNPVVFSVLSGPGSVSGPNGSILNVNGAGTIVVAADQAGNTNYSAAPEVTQTLIVNTASQTIAFAMDSPVTYSPNPLLKIGLVATDATSPNSGNAITFTVASGPGIIPTGGNVLTVTGAGTIIVNADQAGNANYSAAPTVSKMVVVNPIKQDINFFLPVVSPITFTAGQTYNLLATDASTTNSGLPIIFSLGTRSPAILSGTNNSVLTVTGAGTIVINADQAGNTNYVAAPTVTRQLIVNNAAQAITFTVSSPIVFFGNNPNQAITLSASDAYTPYSISPIVFSVVSGPGSITGNTLTVTGAGSIVIAANQAAGPDQSGDPTGYSAAPTVYQTIVVTQAPQTIVNTTIAGPVTYGVAPITLSANDAPWNGSPLNHSANPIVFTVVSGPGIISGGKLTVTAAGQIILVANQAGDANYLAATEISQTLIVNQATPGVSLTSSLNPVFVSNPVTLTAVVSAPVNTMLTPSGWVTFLNGTTPIGTSLLVPGTGTATATLITSSLPFGTDSITATYTADANYTVASSTALSQKVGDFSISSSTAPQTVVPGSAVVYTFTVAPLAPATTFPTAIALTISGLPVGATYTFSPATVAAGLGSTTVTLTIQTPTTSIASNLQPKAITTLAQGGVNNSGSRLPAQRSPASKLPALAFALLLLPLAGRLRRTGKKLSRMLPLLLLLLAGIAAATGLSGCGGTPSGSFGQAPANYTIQVTGTSINLIHSTSVTLTIE
jgi:hypothetical protein